MTDGRSRQVRIGIKSWLADKWNLTYSTTNTIIHEQANKRTGGHGDNIKHSTNNLRNMHDAVFFINTSVVPTCTENQVTTQIRGIK